MTTLAQIETQYGLTHLDHLDRDADLPTVTRLAFQGDVAIIRRAGKFKPATTPIPPAGFPAVRGENGGNTHLLVGVGCYDQQAPSASNLMLGVLTVPAGGTCLLSHPEHGGMVIAPGTYELRRQREQADELRLVAD